METYQVLTADFVMRSIRFLTVLFILLITACNPQAQQATPAPTDSSGENSSSLPTSVPAEVPTAAYAPPQTSAETSQLVGPTQAPPSGALFRSDRFHLSVKLPPGWTASEGPKALAEPFTGWVSFNSWGETGFWATEIEQEGSRTYSPEVVLAQMPADGIYGVLVEQSGGPVWEQYGPEYDREDLGGIWDEAVCQAKTPGSDGSSLMINFFKWARFFHLEVYCGADVSDATRTELDSLLANWQFDKIAAGDVGWALVTASQQLPQEVGPNKFIVPAKDEIRSNLWEETVLRQVYAGEGNEKNGTIYVEFVYAWDYPDLVQGLTDCPNGNCHRWSYQVKPDGEISVIGDSGSPLPGPDHPTPTALPTWSSLAAESEPPAFLYLYENQVMEVHPRNGARIIAALPELGEADAISRLANELFLLRTKGLQSVDLAREAGETLVNFETPMRYGQLLADAENGRIFYSATGDSACSDTGKGGWIGYYDAAAKTSRGLLSEEFSMRVLGISQDGQTLYSLPVGCDPSFGPIWAVSLESGQKERELATEGYLFSHLSPDGRYFATQHTRFVDYEKPPDELLAIYDLQVEPASLREIELPEPGSHIQLMQWSNHSRFLYFTLLSEDPDYAEDDVVSYGLHQYDVESNRVVQITQGSAGGIPLMNHNENWLMLRQSGDTSAYLVDMDTGQVDELSLPYPAIPAPYLQGWELPSELSLDGNWLLVWHVPQGVASIVHLPSGSVGLVDMPEGATLIGWR